MKTQVLAAADALWMYVIGSTSNPFDRVVHDPLHDYLKKEADRAAKRDHPYDLGPDADKLVTAVRMLGSWRMEEDIPVFRALLNHPGTSDTRGFIIRQWARDALIMQGQAVPKK
jgi:hypothetical protein